MSSEVEKRVSETNPKLKQETLSLISDVGNRHTAHDARLRLSLISHQPGGQSPVM